MPRRRKGRDIHGWLVIDKPAGIGSTDVVTRVRRALDAKKAGHAGTLDPAATGVLAVALGEATKCVPFLQDAAKTYAFAVRFGTATDTDDAEGEVIGRTERVPDEAAIRAALPALTGEIMQVPPRYSAVKVGGERAYDLARDGEAVDLAARPLTVHALTLDRMEGDTAHLTMTCGKGGYVRAVARDLGPLTGSLAHCAWLHRTRSGPFDAGDGLTLDALGAMTPEEIEARLLPPQAALSLPEVRATEAGAARLRNGNPGEAIPVGEVGWGDTAFATRHGTILAIGRWQGGMLAPDRVLNMPTTG